MYEIRYKDEILFSKIMKYYFTLNKTKKINYNFKEIN